MHAVLNFSGIIPNTNALNSFDLLLPMFIFTFIIKHSRTHNWYSNNLLTRVMGVPLPYKIFKTKVPGTLVSLDRTPLHSRPGTSALTGSLMLTIF